MPDTVRTKSEILGLFPDNTSKAISPQDLRDFVVSLGAELTSGVTISTAAATSYSNLGGTGARIGMIGMSWTNPLFIVNTPFTSEGLFDGYTSSQTNLYPPNGTGFIGEHFTLDFHRPVVINEMKLYTQFDGDQGTWQPSGSNDGETFSNIGSPVAFGTTNPRTIAFTNSTPYRYYRFTGSSGTVSQTWWCELEFKIGSADETLTVLSVAGTQILAWRAGALFFKAGSDWHVISALPAAL
jgi:hypothetical protein